MVGINNKKIQYVNHMKSDIKYIQHDDCDDTSAACNTEG